MAGSPEAPAQGGEQHFSLWQSLGLLAVDTLGVRIMPVAATAAVGVEIVREFDHPLGYALTTASLVMARYAPRMPAGGLSNYFPTKSKRVSHTKV